MYFDARTKLSEELILYTNLSLFAEIGGYVGLLLGVSIWNFTTWISDILELKLQKEKKIQIDSTKLSIAHSYSLFQIIDLPRVC